MFDEDEIHTMPPNARVDIGVDTRDGVHFAIVDFVCKTTGDIISHYEKECDDEDEALEIAREAAGVIEDTFEVEGTMLC